MVAMEQGWAEEIGGLDGMRVILEDFYERLLRDVMVGFFFQGRDQRLLVERQLQFTARALGAPIVYQGQSIPKAHAGLPILAGHFDRRHQILKETLEAHQVPDAFRTRWLALDQSFRRAVIKKKR